MKQILCTFILSFAAPDVSTDGFKQTLCRFVDGDRTVTFRYVNKQVKHVTIEGSFQSLCLWWGKRVHGFIGQHLSRRRCTPYRFAIGGKKKVTDPLNPNVVCDIDDSVELLCCGWIPWFLLHG